MTEGRSASYALAVGPGTRRRIGQGELVIPRDAEALCRRNSFVVETVLHATMEDADAHHREQL